MSERSHTFTRDDGETTVEVVFEITSWGSPATWDDPADPVEIDLIRVEDGAILVELTAEESERAQTEIYEGDYFDDDDGPDPDDARDAEIDRRLCEGN